jgi:hypothetical protein
VRGREAHRSLFLARHWICRSLRSVLPWPNKVGRGAAIRDVSEAAARVSKSGYSFGGTRQQLPNGAPSQPR